MTEEKDDLILSDKVLTKEQSGTLSALAELLIPASEDGRMPSAAELDLLPGMCDESGALVPEVGNVLAQLDQRALEESGQGFAMLGETDRYQLIEAIKQSQPGFIEQLMFRIAANYYQDDRVMNALGLEARAPYPLGNTVEAGDLSLLDPVRKRPKLYRE